MELKEVKHILEDRKSILINSSIPDASLITAIDTVLEELNNSISKDKIENKIKKYEEELKYEITRNEAKIIIKVLRDLLKE